MDIRFSTSIESVGRDAWSSLDHADNPFLSFDWLHAMESSGAASPQFGWHPQHCTLWDMGDIVAAAPLYSKDNSHGEFVFDWAWADAYHRHGLDYYPKLLCAVPFSPVRGPRLLVSSNAQNQTALKRELVNAITSRANELGLSSAHWNFVLPDDAKHLASASLLQRTDWQFHWTNQGYSSFDDFLATLSAKKRKNIRHERRKVANADFTFERIRGSEATAAQLKAAYDCYRITFHYKGNTAVLTREFFESLATASGDPLLFIMARRNERYVAAAIFVQGGGTLYGRYWGCYEEYSALHFETCYYQGLEHCIDTQLSVFEPGAQGPHKISRGFLPTQVESYHHIAEPAFRRAIADYLEDERRHREASGAQLEARSPYRKDLDLTGQTDAK